MDNIADIYICNDLRLIIDFIKKLTKIRESIVNKIFSGYKTI